jgi:hypothetical protein
MQNLKYISPILKDIYTKKYINYKETRLKTINMINIIDMFLNRYICFNKDNMKLNSRVLKSLYGNSYVKYIEYLMEYNFIYLFKNYSSGIKSKCYKLTEKTKRNGYLSITVDVPKKLYDKTIQLNIANNLISDTLKNKLIKDLYKMDLNIVGAKQWIDNNIDINDKAHLMNLNACNKIAIKDIYYSFDNYGRFHTNYTILKKDIRNNFLTFGKDKIKEIDITNSQPFFLYLLMRQNGFIKFNGFDTDVMTGVIYDKIKDISGKDRKEVKVNIYSVLFGRNMSKNYWNILFNNLYPDVYEWICAYKKQNKNYKIIAHKLQRIESNFIFNKLIPNVLAEYNNLPIITIHDSIIIPEYAYVKVKTIFIQSLNELIIKNTSLDLL